MVSTAFIGSMSLFSTFRNGSKRPVYTSGVMRDIKTNSLADDFTKKLSDLEQENEILMAKEANQLSTFKFCNHALSEILERDPEGYLLAEEELQEEERKRIEEEASYSQENWRIILEESKEYINKCGEQDCFAKFLDVLEILYHEKDDFTIKFARCLKNVYYTFPDKSSEYFINITDLENIASASALPKVKRYLTRMLFFSRDLTIVELLDYTMTLKLWEAGCSSKNRENATFKALALKGIEVALVFDIFMNPVDLKNSFMFQMDHISNLQA